MSELRGAFRTLRVTPVVTLIAILSLALGIGANTAIFSIVDSLLLRSLPVERPDRLALLVSNPPCFAAGHDSCSSWSYPLWEQIRERRRDLFQTAFAFRSTRLNVATGGETDFVQGLWASSEYFDALGVPARMGRVFLDEDDRRGGGPNGPTAIISHAFWQSRFESDPSVVGRTLSIERVPFTIVGVMPPGFFGAEVGSTFEVAVPLGTEPLIRRRESALDRSNSWWLKVMARLRDDQTFASAEQVLRGVQPQLREATLARDSTAERRANYLREPVGVQSGALGTSAMRASYRQPILTIMVVVVLVLLIACANIANLLLARAAARRHEFSLYLALGASRWHLLRRLLVESLLLSGAGALIGLLIARWGSDLLVRQLSTRANSVFLDVRLDWRVLAFTTLVAVAAALLFGIVPALRASEARPIEAIREQGRGTVGNRRNPLGSGFVSGQLALSVVLVVSAGLFTRTLASLATRDLGFDRDAVLVAQMDLKASGDEPAERGALYQRILETARAIPGVANAAISDVTPVSGWVLDVDVEIENGRSRTVPQNVSYVNTLTPGWFTTYGTPIVAGRDFDERDRLTSPPVAIVNETFVRTFLPNGSPLGLRIRNAQPSSREQAAWMDIVGVAADATYRSIRDPVPPTLYLPLAQQPEAGPSMSLSLRAATGAPDLLAPNVAESISRTAPEIAITVYALKEQVEAALMQERILAMLSGFFGVLALLLAGLGLYGLTSYTVSRRRGEFGIRMALGASGSDIVRMVLGRVCRLVGAGLAAGGLASLWACRYVETLLYGVTPYDAATLIVASVVFAAVGALAGWLPARRAARLDPALVLREE